MGEGEITVAALGAVVLMRGDRAVATRSAFLRTVLALLALEPGSSVSPGKLIDELWGEDTPADARASLQVVVSRLRKWAADAGLPEGCIRFDHGGYQLSLPREGVDLARFEDGLSSADREREPAKRLAICEQTLALWRSEPFSGCAGSVMLEIEAARLSDARLQLLEWQAEALCDLGEYPRALTLLGALAKEHPARERFTWLTMVALYRQGRQREALAAYASTRRRLAEEFGLDPSPDLVDLEAKILVQSPDLGEPAAGDVAAALRPAARTRPLLIGRDSELEALSKTLRTGSPKRLVVLKGSAGAGKSTLLEALCHDAALEGTTVITGRFDEGPSPLSGWVPTLALLGIDLDSAAASGAIATAQSIVNHIAAGGESSRLLVALEDIHLADSASLSLFVEIARAALPEVARVVVTARDPDLLPRAGWSAALANASLTGRVEEISLSELAAEHVRTVAELRLGHFGADAVPRLATLIWNRTGGHPLHMSALVETMATEPDFDRSLAAGHRVPSSLLPLFVHQMGTLPEPCQDLVEALAVVGPAPVERLAAISGMSAPAVTRELHPAIKLGVVAHRVEGFDLRHALIRDAVIDRMPEPTVMDLNHAALQDVEARGGDPFEALRFAAGARSLLSPERLGRVKLAAGRVAYQRGAMTEAEQLLSGARASLFGAERAEASVFLGLTLAELGRESESDDLLEEALEREPGLDPELQILAAAGDRLGSRVAGSQLELSRAQLVERRTRSMHSRSRGLLLARLLRLQTLVGPPFDTAMLDEIEQLSRDLEDPELVSAAISVRESMGQMIDPGARLSAAEDYYQAMTFTDDMSSRMLSTMGLLRACVITGQTERARDLLWELRRLGDRTGRRYIRWFAGTAEAALLAASGDEGAEARAVGALELGSKLEIPDALGTYGVHLVFSNWLAGTLPSIAPAIEQAVKTYPRIVAWWAVAAAADLQNGDRARAGQKLADYLRRRLESAGLLFDLPALCVAATVAFGLEDQQSARSVLAALPKDSDEFAVVGTGPAAIAGPVRLFTGLLRLGLEDTEAAVKDLAAAEQLSASAGLPPWVAACRYVYETFLKRPDDRTNAPSGPFPLGLTPPSATRS